MANLGHAGTTMQRSCTNRQACNPPLPSAKSAITYGTPRTLIARHVRSAAMIRMMMIGHPICTNQRAAFYGKGKTKKFGQRWGFLVLEFWLCIFVFRTFSRFNGPHPVSGGKFLTNPGAGSERGQTSIYACLHLLQSRSRPHRGG